MILIIHNTNHRVVVYANEYMYEMASPYFKYIINNKIIVLCDTYKFIGTIVRTVVPADDHI